MELSPAAMAALEGQLDAADVALGDLDRQQARARRRSQGAYFTPRPLVRFVCQWALESFEEEHGLRWRSDGIPEIEVVDPSAGDGRFLVEMRELLTARAVQRGAEASRARVGITRHCLRAVELDSDFAAACARALGEGARVESGEALLQSSLAEGSVDLVIGNPPYRKSANLGQELPELRRALQGMLRSTEAGEWDVYGAFIERGLQWLRPGGRVAFVVPSRWWTARWARGLRDQLTREGAVAGLVDFGARQLFDGATVYSSLCLLRKGAAEELEVLRRRSWGWDAGRLDPGALGDAPWRLSVGHARRLVERLTQGGRTLASVCKIFKGAGTNADAVYVDPPDSVESALVLPVFRGRDVGREDAATHRLLVPYDDTGELLTPATLATEYPGAHAHLQAHRERLESRERGRYAGARYYRYGRPQNLCLMRERAPKVVIPDVVKRGRAVIEREGAMLLDSAYALRPHGNEVSAELLWALMRSPVVDFWLQEHGLPLRGGYRRMKTAYLETMPVPAHWNSSLEDELQALIRKELATDDAVDELVRRGYGLSPDEWNALSTEA